MQTYIAHYRSLNSSAERATGLFEFESDARLNSKGNQHDARMKMLELFGKEAVSWTIDKIERKKARETKTDGQLEFDFREPCAPRKRRASKKYW